VPTYVEVGEGERFGKKSIFYHNTKDGKYVVEVVKDKEDFITVPKITKAERLYEHGYGRRLMSLDRPFTNTGRNNNAFVNKYVMLR